MGGGEEGMREGGREGWEEERRAGGREGGKEGRREGGMKQAGYNTHLITIEVGARGVPHMAGFCRLKQELRLTRTEFSSLLSHVSHKAIEGSFSIWCSRNRVT